MELLGVMGVKDGDPSLTRWHPHFQLPRSPALVVRWHQVAASDQHGQALQDPEEQKGALMPPLQPAPSTAQHPTGVLLFALG